MNWYKVFYWITVADGVKGFFDVASNLFTTLAIVAAIAWIIGTLGYTICVSVNQNQDDKAEAEDSDTRAWLKLRSIALQTVRPTVILAIIMWLAYVFVPTKKDALLIIAGGAVGNFITSDSSARQLPSEFTLLIREKMKAEIQELKNPIPAAAEDTLKSKTKEELIEMYKNLKK